MSELREWAAVSPDGVVTDRFQMSAAQADGLFNPAWAEGTMLHDVTDVDPPPRGRWIRTDVGWEAPDEMEIVIGGNAEEDTLRSADNVFIEEMLTKVRAGDALTQDERDKLTILQLVRGAH